MPTRNSICPLRRTSNQTPNGIKSRPRILLLDDSEAFRSAPNRMLKMNGCDVVAAANVNEALKLIGEQTFDVPLSDSQMPRLRDGLAVVSARRHSNAQAFTLLFTAYAEMKRAAEAILLRAEDILKTNQAPRGFQ